MKYILCVLISLIACSPPLFAQSTPVDRDLTTPKPATPIWETQRDLIVMFDNSDDRVALALQIKAISLDISNGLTTQQRFDGLSIAGHTLWSAAKYEDAAACFGGVMGLDVSDDAIADAARMKGQCHFFNGQYQQATDAYLECYNLSNQIEANEGYNSLSHLVIVMLIDSARKAENFALSMQITDDALADTNLRESARTQALRKGALAALAAGNNPKAQIYLTTLLDEYPDFGLDDIGSRVNVEMDLIKANGYSIEDKDPEAVDALAALVQDPRYIGLSCWTSPVEQLAKLLGKIDKTEEANAMRLWAVDRISEKINTRDPDDPNTAFFNKGSRKDQLVLLQSAAHAYRKQRMYQEQAEVLDQMISDFGDLDPDIINPANAELARLAEREILPSP